MLENWGQNFRQLGFRAEVLCQPAVEGDACIGLEGFAAQECLHEQCGLFRRSALAQARLGARQLERVEVRQQRSQPAFEAVDGRSDVAQPLHDMENDDWRYVVETNLVGTLAYARGALDRMLRRQEGHLVLISSISPDIKARGESVYAATKAGINAFAMTLRKEIGEKSIRVTVIEPGSVGTDMQECSLDEQREAIAQGEMLFAEEIAEGIIFALTRSPRCDVSLLRMEPIRQKTA